MYRGELHLFDPESQLREEQTEKEGYIADACPASRETVCNLSGVCIRTQSSDAAINS